MFHATTLADPAPIAALFPPREEREARESRLTRALANAQERIEAGAVPPRIDLDTFRAELARYDFAEPRPLDETIAWTIAQLESGVTHITHPRYFGLFNPAPTHPAQIADRIVGALNPQLASATTSPAAVAIEAHVIRALASRAGLGDRAGGHFTSNGSEANFTALICALTNADPAYATSGVRAFRGHPVFYVSRDSHLAWVKIAHMAGLGRDACRLIPTDGTGRMDPHALLAGLAQDCGADAVPVMIAATAGTTNAGMIDPLDDCAEIARRFGLWFHVDAAWGGAALASDRLRPALAGIERADSVTIDAHKWFATTMGCGMFLTSRPAVLPAAFQVGNSFMPSQAPSVDPYMTSMQWSRRFLGLRLFLSLATGGWAGHAAQTERAVDLAASLRARVEPRGWRAANLSPFAVLNLLPPPGAPDVRTIVARVLQDGRAWISAAVFEGFDVVRVCVTHGETNEEDVGTLAAALEDAVVPSAALEDALQA